MHKFAKGDRVVWNSHGNATHGTVVRSITEETQFKGVHYHASVDEPYYEVESDNGGTAVHKATALKKA